MTASVKLSYGHFEVTVTLTLMLKVSPIHYLTNCKISSHTYRRRAGIKISLALSDIIVIIVITAEAALQPLLTPPPSSSLTPPATPLTSPTP